MAGNTSVDLARVPGDNRVAASPDLLRAMVQALAEALMGADADAICGAPCGQTRADRVNYRNGYRQRRWDTWAGMIGLVPAGVWLLTPCHAINDSGGDGQALGPVETHAVVTDYCNGTWMMRLVRRTAQRRMPGLVLGIRSPASAASEYGDYLPAVCLSLSS